MCRSRSANIDNANRTAHCMYMSIPKRDKEGLFTYSDYLTWPDDERWELIDGVAYDMSPAPERRHQGVLAYLASRFVNHFENEACSVYIAPFDVVLPNSEHAVKEEESANVVQPDLVVVCDSSKLTTRGCTGAPDFVLEILSPSTAFKDMDDKLHLYERHGVREYWILNPANDTLIVYSVLPAATENTSSSHAPPLPVKYCKPVLHTSDEVVSPRVFPELSIDLTRVFERDRERNPE